MKPLTIIQAPSNLGLKEPKPNVEPGVKFLPQALLNNGFATQLNITDIRLVQPAVYSMNVDEETKVRNADSIVQYSIALAETIYNTVKSKLFPVVIGGDCSLLLGSMMGLRKAGNYGLFFLDGHTDYMLPQHSSTGGAAGMDLAFATGNGHEKLSNIHGLSPYVKEENCFCVGNRECTGWYVELIKQSKIKYYPLDVLRNESVKKVAADFLQRIAAKKPDGFWIHLDADVLNDDIMPCVDSRQPGGLTYAELKELLIPLLSSQRATGIEITIVDPTLDTDNTYVPAFCKEMIETFKF